MPYSLDDSAGLKVSSEDFLAATLETIAQPIWVVDHDVDLLPGELGALDAVATANHGPSLVAVQPCVVLVRQFEVERGQVGRQVLEREGSGDRDDDR